MNTPPTMSAAPLPMAPVKSNRKQLNKLDIKPKKLKYFDQDVEKAFQNAKEISEEAVESQEKLQLPAKSELKDSTETKLLAKHVEQNELDNEAVQTKVEHPYNLRRRNKNPIFQCEQLGTNKKIVKKKFEEDKENFRVETAGTSGRASVSTLSQPDVNLSNWEKLEWLQSRRDVGIWVECCNKNCKKWRFVNAFHEPVQVPEFWICSMNPNEKFSSCQDPEDSEYIKYEEDLIENEYNAGSLVWGRVNGYPWWPGMVDDCPETLSYYELKGSSNVPVRYHVIFFEKEISRSWLARGRIKPLKRDDTVAPVKRAKAVYRGQNYAEALKQSLEQAKSAIPLNIRERLEKFSFRTRCLVKTLTNPMTTASIKKSKKKPPCRIGVKKSSKKRKVNFKRSQIPAPSFPSVQTDNAPSFFEPLPTFPTSSDPEPTSVLQESVIYASNKNSSDSRASTPYNRERSLVVIEYYVKNISARKHKELTGNDLFEDTRLREERFASQEAEYKSNNVFALEYDIESKSESQTSSQKSSSYGSPRSEYIFGSQANSTPSPDIMLLPRVVLKRHSNIEALIQALAKKVKRN